MSFLECNKTFRHLKEYCGSDDLSLDGVQEIVSRMQNKQADYSFFPFLHQVCTNSRVTFEVVEYLLGRFPQAARRTTTKFSLDDGDTEESTYALHLACCNTVCPNAVIQLLVQKYPLALQHSGTIYDKETDDCTYGLPLHQYLLRPNIDIDTVKLIVEEYPQALMVVDDTDSDSPTGNLPIHTLLWNEDIASNLLHDVLQYLIDTEPSAVRVENVDGLTPLHVACSNRNVTPGIIHLLLDSWPGVVNHQDNHGKLPIHTLCENGFSLEEKLSLNILVEASPSSVERADAGGISQFTMLWREGHLNFA